jgi:hypothetical protein
VIQGRESIRPVSGKNPENGEETARNDMGSFPTPIKKGKQKTVKKRLKMGYK